MSIKQGVLGLVAICMFVIVLSIAGLVSDFATRLEFNIDGLLLLLVCLLMGGIFSLMLLLVAREQGWLDWIAFLRKKPVTEAPSAKSASPAPAKGAAQASPAKPASPAASKSPAEAPPAKPPSPSPSGAAGQGK